MEDGRLPPSLLEPSEKSQRLREQLVAFFNRHIYPNEALFHQLTQNVR